MYRETLQTVIGSIWPSLLILITILFTIRFFSFISNRKRIVLYHEILNLVFVIYLMCFFYVLTFEDVDWSTANLIPFKEIFRFEVGSRMFIRNVVGNILLFLPYGFYLSYFVKLKRVKYVLVFSLIVSIAVEIIQYRIGRVFDIDDVILNIVGGTLGYYLYRLGNYVLNKTRIQKIKEPFCNLVTIAVIIGVILYMGV